MLAIDVTDRFKRRLLDGDPPPGAFITLKEMAKLLGVPFAKAREAAQRLEHEGFVQIHAQRGVQVRDITLKSIRAAFGFRRIMEEAALRHFCLNASKETIASLIETTQSLADRLPNLPQGDLDQQMAEVDWQMHFSIIESLSNAYLLDAYKTNTAHIRWIRATSEIPAARHSEVLREHLDILEVCMERDVEAALVRLDLHLKNSLGQALGLEI